MKNSLLFALFFACSVQAFAQSSDSIGTSHTKKKTGLFLKLGIGYAFPQAGQTVDVNGTPYAANISYINVGSTYSYNVKKASFSAGLQGVAGLGYMFSKHIGAELDVALGIAPKKYNSTIDSLQIDGYSANETIRQYAQAPVFVAPAIIIQSGGEKINVYARAGIVLPVKNKVVSEVHDNFLTPAYITSPLTDTNVLTRNRTLETTASFSIGFTGALGVSYTVNEDWKIWGEVNLTSLSFYAKQTDVTNYTVNGVNQAGSLNGNNLSYKYSTGSSNVTPLNNVGIQPTYSIPFSSIGINVGVAYCF